MHTYEQRQDLLWQLFDSTLDHLIKILDSPPPEGIKASTLAIIRQFLSDNEVTAKNAGRGELKKRLGQLQGDMKLPFDS